MVETSGRSPSRDMAPIDRLLALAPREDAPDIEAPQAEGAALDGVARSEKPPEIR